MNQKEINYSDIKALGFTEEFAHDQVYFNQYGYEYAIIQKKLTKKYTLIGKKKQDFAEWLGKMMSAIF